MAGRHQKGSERIGWHGKKLHFFDIRRPDQGGDLPPRHRQPAQFGGSTEHLPDRREARDTRYGETGGSRWQQESGRERPHRLLFLHEEM